MRYLNIGKLAAAIMLLGATQVSAYEVTQTSTYAGEALALSDTVVVDVFLDAEPGLQILGVGMLFDSAELAYDAAASEALPPQGPGSSGAQPSYILYAAGKPATALYPLQVPSFATWPAPPADKGQVNINYAEAALNPAVASGTGIYIASVVLEVIGLGDGTADIELTLEAGGNIVRANDIELDPMDVPLNGTPITVTVPEPAAASLAAAACLVTGYLVRRRRA